MSDAPETIWRENISPSEMYPEGGAFYHEAKPNIAGNYRKYRRDDLPATDPMDDPRVKALVELLKEARSYLETCVGDDAKLTYWITAELCRRIDAVLAALEKDDG